MFFEGHGTPIHMKMSMQVRLYSNEVGRIHDLTGFEPTGQAYVCVRLASCVEGIHTFALPMRVVHAG